MENIKVESATNSNGHLVLPASHLPTKIPSNTYALYIFVSRLAFVVDMCDCSISVILAGAKLDNSQYSTVGFTPNKEVHGVRTRPLPAMPQPQSQYTTIKVRECSILL